MAIYRRESKIASGPGVILRVGRYPLTGNPASWESYLCHILFFMPKRREGVSNVVRWISPSFVLVQRSRAQLPLADQRQRRRTDSRGNQATWAGKAQRYVN